VAGARSGGMDDVSLRWLFDPPTASRLVLAHRPAAAEAVECVVSDLVWRDVLKLLRWATAGTGRAELGSGRWWHLAAGCADLLRRLPALCDELGQPWDPPSPPDEGTSGVARVHAVSARLAALLRSPGPLPLSRVAAEVDALGAAAVSALAEGTQWTAGR
jgi:hypothetical protein